MIRYLVFDIETRVDKELVKHIYDPEDSLTLEQAYDAARDQILKQSNQQSDFFPVPFHIPISIATLQADENYRITDEQFKESIATSQEVLDAQTGQSRAQVNYYEALNSYNIAIARLERAMGVLREPGPDEPEAEALGE